MLGFLFSDAIDSEDIGGTKIIIRHTLSYQPNKQLMVELGLSLLFQILLSLRLFLFFFIIDKDLFTESSGRTK